MDRYKTISQFATTLGTGLSVVFGAMATNWIMQFPLPGLFFIGFIVIVVGISRYLIILFFNILFESSQVIRRILLGRQFVEGTWLLEIRLHKELIGFAVVRIEAEGISLRWSGTHYDLEGDLIGAVDGKIIDIRWPVIRYVYKSQRGDESTLHREGYGERSFIERDGSPITFTGFFVDYLSGRRSKTIGSKILDKEEKAKLNDPRKFKEYINNYKGHLLEGVDLANIST